MDVLVVGAGPAGVAAALSAARRGLRVTLVDRAQFPRDKPCGEGLLPRALEALARLRLLGRVRAIAQPLEAIGFRIGDQHARAPIDALGVERRRLDALLLEAAREEVTVLEGVRALAPIFAHGRVVGLCTSRGPMSARYLVCADGLRSPLRDQLGLARSRRRRARLGMRAHYRVASLPFGRSVQVIFDGARELYLTPVAPDRLQIAMLGEELPGAAQFHAQMKRRFDGLQALDRPLGAGPFEQHVESVIAEGALLCGDAAGYLDAITGEGVGLALEQGFAAGQALAADDLPSYARAHRRIVRDSNRLTRTVLFLAEHPWLAKRALHALARRPEWLARLVSGEPFDFRLRWETYLRILISR